MMNEQNISPCEYTVEELDRALKVLSLPISKEQQLKLWEPEGSHQRAEVLRQLRMFFHSSQIPPLHPGLKSLSAPELMLKLRLSIKALDIRRGLWNESDGRKDIFEIADDLVRKNARSVAAVCGKDALNDIGRGNWELRNKPYGEMFKLCESELFYDQPAAAGSICTGVLVDRDIILTSAHFTDRTNIKDLRVLFNYVMANPNKAITRFPEEKIYRGVEVLYRQENSRRNRTPGNDWALVKLDREVKGQEIVELSRELVFPGQQIYHLGHPCGLPLKYSPGNVAQNGQTGHFMAHAAVFMGNSGSPVFSAEDHRMLGLVTKTDAKDFNWAVNGFAPVMYPNKDIESYGARCIRVSEFSRYLRTG